MSSPFSLVFLLSYNKVSFSVQNNKNNITTQRTLLSDLVKNHEPNDNNLRRTTPQKLAILSGEPKAL